MPNLTDTRSTYVATLAFVATRDELPLVLNHRALFGCGVEVGVKEGDFSEQLLERWRGAHLISVDPWAADAPDRYRDIANVPQAQHDRFFARASERLARFGERSSVWRTTSVEASRRIPRHTLDFVYLDARHDRESVLEDLHAWFDRVRPGGIMAGHDYLDGELPAGSFGVRSAVDEFFGERGIPVHATLLDEPWISWMVQIPWPDEQPSLPGAPVEAVVAAAAPAPAAEGESGLGPETRVLGLDFSLNGRPYGFRIALDPAHMSQRIMLEALEANTIYEAETSQFLATVLQPGDVFVDVGTHVGFFTLLGSTLVGPRGRVFAFEPEEYNFRRLRDHLAMNGIQHAVPANVAVGSEEGSATFFFNADNDGGHALWDVGLHGFNQRSRLRPQSRTVPLTTLDHALAPHGLRSIKAIKIDTEGSELAVLTGARRTLERLRVPFVVAEINRFGLQQMGASEAELRGWMRQLGYEAYAFLPGQSTLTRLHDDQTIESDYVFNLLFREPGAPTL